MSFVVQQLTDPSVLLGAWTMMAGLAAPCLVAIWAAVGKAYWFWRVLAVWAVVMLMIPLRAWELAWTFALAAACIAAIVDLSWAVERRWRSASAKERAEATRYRYSLRDLLLLVLLVCLWLPGLVAAARHTPLQSLAGHCRFCSGAGGCIGDGRQTGVWAAAGKADDLADDQPAAGGFYHWANRRSVDAVDVHGRAV